MVDDRDKINVSREIRIIKKLNHPNIVQLYKIIETSKKIYLVMEHVDGGELY
jgi:serine/threonine protein kinase